MEARDLLLKSVQSSLAGAIASARFDPTEFEWIRTGVPEIPIALRLRGTEYYFALDPDYQKCEYLPGDERKTVAQRPGNLTFMLNYFHTWLLNLRREIETPDVWAELGRQREIVAAATTYGDETENTPFTTDEREHINASLKQMRQQINQLAGMTERQLAAINDRLDYIGRASTRLGRKDWIILASNTLVTVAVAFGIPGDLARQMIAAAGDALFWLVGGRPLLSSGA